MKQNRDLVSVLNSIKSAIKYGVAVIVSIFFLLARFGIDKVKAVAPQSFNMALPPADPVHEPPANTTVEYEQQPPV